MTKIPYRKHYRAFPTGMHVAVLYSPGFGAGWSTWAAASEAGEREFLMFDATLVAFVEEGQRREAAEHAEAKIEGFYSSGAEDLVVEWVKVGSLFYIHEYDGAESVLRIDQHPWVVA